VTDRFRRSYGGLDVLLRLGRRRKRRLVETSAPARERPPPTLGAQRPPRPDRVNANAEATTTAPASVSFIVSTVTRSRRPSPFASATYLSATGFRSQPLLPHAGRRTIRLAVLAILQRPHPLERPSVGYRSTSRVAVNQQANPSHRAPAARRARTLAWNLAPRRRRAARARRNERLVALPFSLYGEIVAGRATVVWPW